MSMSMSMALEALAINYLTHTVWAWIAFLTAALSFWKIKPSPSPSPSPLPPPAHPISTSTSPPPPLSDDEPDPDDQQELPSSTTIFCSLENRRSGKFRVYYDGIAVAARARRPIKGSVIRLHNPQRVVLGDHGWEALLKLKTAEMGWYRYQDLTMLDGSVVQLWN